MDNELLESGVWHRGEVAVQQRVGVSEKMKLIGERVVRDFLPEQHREFYSQLPMILISAEDGEGNIWASPLFGDVGFVITPTPKTIQINAKLNLWDPLNSGLESGSDIGLLGIQLETRRRNRINAKIIANIDGHLLLLVKQSFGNCPKYIQSRQAFVNPLYGNFERINSEHLDENLLQLVLLADTFFIASRFCDGEQKCNRGFDISHRGGPSGFIKIDKSGRLLVPDFSGNNFFNTIGNLHQDSASALLFFDFTSGHLLQLSGSTEVIWADEETLPFERVERMLRFTIKKVCFTKNAMPMIWRLEEAFPFNLLYSE